MIVVLKMMVMVIVIKILRYEIWNDMVLWRFWFSGISS